MSFTISEHYCGGSLVDTSWFLKAEGCGMEMDTPQNTNESIVVDTCCNDVITIVDGQDEVKQNNSQLSFEQQVFVTAFVYSYSELFNLKESSEVSYKDYVPPLLVKDIQLLDETFLI